MMIAPGQACQLATKTTISQARCWLASRLVVSGLKPSRVAMIGSEVENRKLNTYEMTSPEMTMGRKNTARRPFCPRILEFRAMARLSAVTFTTMVDATANNSVNPYESMIVGSDSAA